MRTGALQLIWSNPLIHKVFWNLFAVRPHNSTWKQKLTDWVSSNWFQESCTESDSLSLESLPRTGRRAGRAGTYYYYVTSPSTTPGPLVHSAAASSESLNSLIITVLPALKRASSPQAVVISHAFTHTKSSIKVPVGEWVYTIWSCLHRGSNTGPLLDLQSSALPGQLSYFAYTIWRWAS